MKNIFTVVIPLFNKENFIAATIQSVLDQSFKYFEILLVNDSSTDQSVSIANTFLSKKVKMIHHAENKGLSVSRNTGILNSKTDFVVFLDADDLLKVNYLQTLYNLILEFPTAGLFATNYEQIYGIGAVVAPQIGMQNMTKNSLINDFFEISLQQPIYCQSSFCVRKSIFETIGLYSENINYAEDVDFNIRANSSFKLAYCSEKLVQYLMTDVNQITKNTIVGKKIPDLDLFENAAATNKNLKKYLDVNRYMLASVCKKQGDLTNFKKLKKGIHPARAVSGLNQKQIILLNLPVFLLIFIEKLKHFILKKGYRFSSFS